MQLPGSRGGGWYVSRCVQHPAGYWIAEAIYDAGLDDPQPEYSYQRVGDTPTAAKAAVMECVEADKEWPKIARAVR